MRCPRCNSVMRWDNDISYEDCGYEGEGIVSYYHCRNCGVDVEVCIPENEEEE